jgi:hypothetical protein
LFEPSALFGTTSLFGCAFKPSNKAEGSNFQTSPKGSNQAALLLKQTPMGSNHQEKSLKLGDFSVFSCIYQKLLLILQRIYAEAVFMRRKVVGSLHIDGVY